MPLTTATKALDTVMTFRHTPEGMVRGGDWVKLEDVLNAVESAPSASPYSNGTPLTDALEKTRRELSQERTPAYGDALALCRRLERELAAARQALNQPDSSRGCSLGCQTECLAKAHGCASECPALPAQPPFKPVCVSVSPALVKAAKVALNTMDYMLENGEWYCAKERADALREELEKVDSAAVEQPSPPAAAAVVLTRTATPLEALRAYEDAFDDLFCQCASNPITNAWGMQVNMSKLNHAHLLASTALQKNH